MSVIHLTPEPLPSRTFSEAAAAVDYLSEIYDRSTDFLCRAFDRYLAGELSTPTQGVVGATDNGVQKIRAFYPEVSFVNPSYADVDSRLSYGYVIQPGEYSTTITR
nr:hypothetical protein [Gammaproteobacteria bacterium]